MDIILSKTWLYILYDLKLSLFSFLSMKTVQSWPSYAWCNLGFWWVLGPQINCLFCLYSNKGKCWQSCIRSISLLGAGIDRIISDLHYSTHTGYSLLHYCAFSSKFVFPFWCYKFRNKLTTIVVNLILEIFFFQWRGIVHYMEQKCHLK